MPWRMVETTGKIISTSGYDQITFGFFVNNRKHVSNRASCGSQKCKGELLRLQKDQIITVYYNRRIPGFAVVSNEYNISDFNISIGIAILLSFIVVMLLVFDKRISDELLHDE